MNKADYLEIVLKGHFEYVGFLSDYFVREAKKAKDNYINYNEFFAGINSVIRAFYDELDSQFFKERNNCYSAMETIDESEINKAEFIKYTESLSRDKYTVHLLSFTKNKFSGHLNSYQIAHIEEKANIANLQLCYEVIIKLKNVDAEKKLEKFKQDFIRRYGNPNVQNLLAEHSSILKSLGIAKSLQDQPDFESNYLNYFKQYPDEAEVAKIYNGHYDTNHITDEERFATIFCKHFVYFKWITGELTVFVNQNNENPKKETKLSIPTYALLHVYLVMFNGQPVTQQNKNELAKTYGYSSGDRLRNDFTKYQNEDKRLDLKTDNKRAADAHIKRFKDILPLLANFNPKAFEKAKDDLGKLEETYKKYY
jgi:hypothetical protein